MNNVNYSWVLIVSSLLVIFGSILLLQGDEGSLKLSDAAVSNPAFGVYKAPRALPITCEVVTGFRKPGTIGALGYDRVWAEVDLDRRVGQDQSVGYFFVVYKAAKVKPCHLCRDASDCVRSLRYDNLCFREKTIVSYTGVHASHVGIVQGLMGLSPMDPQPRQLPGLDYILAGFKEACRNGV
jgi:hypothetical protein